MLPYHLDIPAFGDWGFNMASNNINIPDLKLPDDLKLSYLNDTNLSSLFVFAKDENTDTQAIKPNTILHPTLLEYYAAGTDAW